MNPNPNFVDDLLKQNTLSTPDEDILVSTLKNSGKFNIVVEGATDLNIYDKLTAKIGKQKIDYHIAGCREEVFKVYAEIKKLNLLDRVAFIADQDSWVFLNEIPPKGHTPDIKADEIIWTEGYSIENDLYVKGELRRLVNQLPENGQTQYENALNLICLWYAFEVDKWDEKSNLPVAKHPKSIFSGIDKPDRDVKLNEDFLSELKNRGFKVPEEFNNGTLPEKADKIKSDYGKYIRGKTLFQLIQCFLKANNCLSTLNHDKLLTIIAIGYSETTLLNDLKEQLVIKLSGLEQESVTEVDKLLKNKEKCVQSEVENELKRLNSCLLK